MPGATAGFDNDYVAQRDAALRSLEDRDLFLLHVEATDEAGHQGEVDEKVASLERWDADVIGPLVDALEGEPFRVLLLPDHATPCALAHPHVRPGAVPALRLRSCGSRRHVHRARGRRFPGGAGARPDGAPARLIPRAVCCRAWSRGGTVERTAGRFGARALQTIGRGPEPGNLAPRRTPRPSEGFDHTLVARPRPRRARAGRRPKGDPDEPGAADRAVDARRQGPRGAPHHRRCGGVKAATRMRKADLIEAILDAANGTAAPMAPMASTPPTPAERLRRPSRRTATTPRSRDVPCAPRALAARRRPDRRPRRRGGRARRRPPTTLRHRGHAARTAADATTIAATPVGRRSADAATCRRRRRCPTHGRPRRRRRRPDGDAHRPRGRAPVVRRRQPPRPAPPPRPRWPGPAPAASRGPGDFQGDPVEVEGTARPARRGLRLPPRRRLPARQPEDVYVSASQVRRFALRKGDFVKGTSRPQASNEKYPALLRVDEINGMTPDDARSRPRFEDLTPLFPDSKLRLELADDPHEITGRIVDLIVADREGPARVDRVAAEGGQDHDPQADRLRDRAQQPRGAPHGAARRRAARRGHRHAPPRAAGRGGREHVRPSLRRAHAGRRARHRAGQAARRDGQGRRDRARRHHPPRPGVQPRRADVGAHHVGWRRLHRALPAEEVLRRRAQHRGGRLAHDHRHRARSRRARRWTR